MTVFLLSHNLQVPAQAFPPFDGAELAEGLERLCVSITSSTPLTHPHWRIRVESPADPEEMALELVNGWALLRREGGDSVDHTILALGGRKDTPDRDDSPLKLGHWGVDVVETQDAHGFLDAINWPALRAGRPADGVFEVMHRPS